MKYQTGEKTLKNIGNKLGDITPTMVNRLFNNAIEKVKILTYNKPLEFFTVEEDQAFLLFIDECRRQALEEFIKLFKKSDYDLYDFIYLLKSKQYITEGDIRILKEKEIIELIEIKSSIINGDLQNIKKIFDEDLNKDDNIHTLFQSVVSRFAFPNKKRGRPRKEI